MVPRFRLAMLVLCTACSAPTCPGTDAPTDPAQAQLLVDDVDRYWRAYDAGGRSGRSTVFQQRYLDSASAGLREFLTLRELTASSLGQVASAYPAYFDALRDWWRSTPDRSTVLATIRANYARLKQCYPSASFPPVTVLVGSFRTGGTLGSRGLLIGFEFFGRDAAAPTAELPAFARENQKSWATDLAPLVAHEHTHHLSLRAGATAGRSGSPLLAQALFEGVAEFIGALGSGQPSYLRAFRGWQANEAGYFAEFLREKDGSDVSRWLYNQGSTSRERPGDLGYFMGFRIAEAYYLRASDKARAIRELIELRNPAAILAQSGYQGSGPALPDPSDFGFYSLQCGNN